MTTDAQTALPPCITEIDALGAKATPRPWTEVNGGIYINGTFDAFMVRPDGAFMKALANHYPELRELIVTQAQEIAKLKRQHGGVQAAQRRAQQQSAAALDRVVELEGAIENAQKHLRRQENMILALRRRETFISEQVSPDELRHNIRLVTEPDPGREWRPLVIGMATALQGILNALEFPFENEVMRG